MSLRHCCISGNHLPELLINFNVQPRGNDVRNRLYPQNWICINALHDKAFEVGLITVTPDYQIKFSSTLLKQSKSKVILDNFAKYHNKSIILPSRFLPDPSFLNYHNNERFIQ